MGSASDDLAYIAGETVDFVDNTVASVNDILSRIDYVSDSAPAILGDVEAAGGHISEAMGWLGEVNRDLDIIGQMQGSSYNETNSRLLSITTGSGGTASASTTNPPRAARCSYTSRPIWATASARWRSWTRTARPCPTPSSTRTPSPSPCPPSRATPQTTP